MGTVVPLAKKRFHDDENEHEVKETGESPEIAHCIKHIFYVVLYTVNGGLTGSFSAAKQISDTFSFLWNYKKMPWSIEIFVAGRGPKYKWDSKSRRIQKFQFHFIFNFIEIINENNKGMYSFLYDTEND